MTDNELLRQEYERGFIDGMQKQKQMQSSVDKAVNSQTQGKQEPVAWISEGSGNLHWDKVEALADSDGWITPLYKEKNT